MRFSGFDFHEWLLFRPLKWAIKDLRNNLLMHSYLKSIGNYGPSFNIPENSNLLITIAFERPELTKLQIQAIKRFLPEVCYVIADNSRDNNLSNEIKELCVSKKVNYVKLPYNKTSHPNRNHSMALQWVFEKIIKNSGCKSFGFIDHDIFPIKTNNPFVELSSWTAYGRKWFGEKNNIFWDLWPGYMFHSATLIDNFKHDFFYDFGQGLDTNGKNYFEIYRHIQHETKEATFKYLNKSFDGVDVTYELIDDSWLHFGGAGHIKVYEKKMAFFREIINGDKAIEAYFK